MGAESGDPVPPRPDAPSSLSRTGVAGFALVSIAVAMLLPAVVLFLGPEHSSSWPLWVGLFWVLSLLLGSASLVVLLVAERSIRRARGALGGISLVGWGLVLAGMGTLVNLFIGLAGAMSNSL